jgi:HSP20 family protein
MKLFPRYVVNDHDKSSPGCSPTGLKRTPRYQLQKSEFGASIRVDLPGVAKDKLSVTVENNSLRIEGVCQERPEQGWRKVHQETASGDYTLLLDITARYDAGKVQAEWHDGVLRLNLPYSEVAQARQIEINS